MKTKQRMRMEVKEISAEGTFEGLLSVYNNVDLGGDLVEPGAFTRTIQANGGEVPLLWQHKTDVPIGKLTLMDGADALAVKGQLLMSLPEAQKAYLLLKARIVKGLSIGFSTVKEVTDGAVRRLKEIKLYEGSLVTFPQNELALITSIKARAEKKDFTSEFAELQLQDAAYQMWIALRNSLCSLPWAPDLTRDEKIASSGLAIRQFSGAYMAFIPGYLDWLAEESAQMMDGQMSRPPLETKEGRKVSRATKSTLSTAREHMKSADDLIMSLLDEEEREEEDILDEPGAQSKSMDPAAHRLHNAIDALRSLIPTGAVN